MAAVLGLGTLLVASPAFAADRSDLIDPATISVEGTWSSDPNDPLVQYEQVSIDFTYSSQGLPAPVAGDTFTLQLPDEFRAADLTFDLEHPNGDVLGSCVVAGGSAATVTCTFNDKVSNYEYVAGAVWVQAQVTQSTTSETVEFVVDGEAVPVDLPGDGGVTPEEPSFPEEPAKWGWFSNDERSEIVWTLYVHGSDTGTSDPFVIHDQLGPNQTMVTDDWTIQRQNTPGADSWTTVSSYGAPNGVSFDVDGSQTAFDLSIPRELLSPDSLYRVFYHSSTTTSGLDETYQNTATFDEYTLAQDVTRHYTGGGSINGAGFGSLSVQKLAIEGDGAQEVPDDAAFTVLASYQLNGEDITSELSLTAGGDAEMLTNLPTGTVVTLSEIALPALDGVEWANPLFSASSAAIGIEILDEGQSARVTIQEQQTVGVELTNTATPVTTPPVTTPPVTTPPTTPPTTTTPPAPTTPPATPPTTPPAPTVAPTPPTPPAPPMDTPVEVSDNEHLAQTGTDLGPLAGIAAGLMLAGATILVAVRRRQSATQ